MRTLRHLLITAAIMLAGLVGAAAPAAAAESYDNCTGFIDAIPTAITTQGVWCLRQDLTSASTNIKAIDIQTNNVTIDCNGFKLGNLGAGTGTGSYGINANGMNNITVRHCTIQGFRVGIYISGGSGHLVEDDRLLLSREIGIDVAGTGTVVRRNAVSNTVGGPGVTTAYAIIVQADLIDNVVDGVSGDSGVAIFSAQGIHVYGTGSVVQGNRVRNLVPKSTGLAYGIYADATAISLLGNFIVQGTDTGGFGVFCGAETRIRDNLVKHYTFGLWGSDCHDDGGNVL